MKDRRRTILIVDDSEDDRFLLERTLKKVDQRLTIRTARDRVEAVEYLDGKREFRDRKQFPFPSFILVDLKMPRLDGLTVLRHLKENPKWAIIPNLVFTSSSDPDDIKKSFLMGACAYHVKPSCQEEREKLCRLLLDYWATSEVPQTDENGEQLKTDSSGKIGEDIPQP